MRCFVLMKTYLDRKSQAHSNFGITAQTLRALRIDHLSEPFVLIPPRSDGDLEFASLVKRLRPKDECRV